MLGNKKGRNTLPVAVMVSMGDSTYEFYVRKQAQGSLSNYESSETDEWQTEILCVSLCDRGACLNSACLGSLLYQRPFIRGCLLG